MTAEGKRFTFTMDGDAPEAIESLSDFAQINDFDGETIDALNALAVGGAMTFGGGAAPFVVIRREA